LPDGVHAEMKARIRINRTDNFILTILPHIPIATKYTKPRHYSPLEPKKL
jgi:hypothetical protein